MNFKFIILLLIILMLYFPMRIKPLNIESGRIVIWSLFLVLPLLYKNFLNKTHLSSAFLIILLTQISYIFLTSLFNGYLELTFLLFYLEKLIVLPIIITVLLSWSNMNVDKLYSLFGIVVFLQVATMLINLAMPVTKELISSFVESGVPKSIYSFRHIGLTGFVSYSNGFLLFLSLPIYLVTRKRFHLCLAVVSFFLAVIFSRSAIVIYGLFLFIVIFELAIHLKIKKKFISPLFLVLLTMPIVLYFVIINVPKSLVLWVFDIFISLASGKLPDGFLVLRDQVWLPSIKTFIFGDSRLTGSSGSYYMNTDVGYMRYILYFGIIGLCIHFLLLAIFFISNMSFKEKPMRAAFIAYLFCIIIVTYKGNFIMDTWGLLVGFLFFSQKLKVK